MTRHDETSARATMAGKAAPGVFAAAGLIAVVTLAARALGFGRWLVFSQSVGATCVGSVYQAANQLPNVIFEVAAGGALAAVAVPIIAGQLADRAQDEAAQTASAMLTWALAVLAPLSIVMAAAARPLSTVLVDSQRCSGSTDLMAAMLVVFAPQIALYGVGIVLAGVLQAHRRFLAAAAAPLLSSVVVMAAYLLYAALAQGRGNDLTRLPVEASTVLAVGTTLGVVALSLPLLIPVHRAGIRLHLTWAFPPGVARRARALAGAVPFASGRPGTRLSTATAAATAGAAMVALPDDLSGRSMLGDTGANSAGALIGAALVARTGLCGRLLALASVTALTLASEMVSFTNVIESSPTLSRLDALGRPPRPSHGDPVNP